MPVEQDVADLRAMTAGIHAEVKAGFAAADQRAADQTRFFTARMDDANRTADARHHEMLERVAETNVRIDRIHITAPVAIGDDAIVRIATIKLWVWIIGLSTGAILWVLHVAGKL